MATKIKDANADTDSATADKATKGRLKVLWEGNPVLVGPIYLDSTGYKHKGKLKQYKNFAGEFETIALTPTKSSEGMVFFFDLDDPEQAARAAFVQQFAADGMFAQMGNKVKVINEFDHTVDKGKVIRRRNRLMGLVEEKIAEGTVSLRNLALNLGIEVKGLKNSIIEAKVLSETDVNTPAKFDWLEKILGDPNYEVKATLLYAKERGIVSVSNHNWMYKETHLGATLDDAIKYCHTNDITFQAIKEQTDSM